MEDKPETGGMAQEVWRVCFGMVKCAKVRDPEVHGATSRQEEGVRQKKLKANMTSGEKIIKGGAMRLMPNKRTEQGKSREEPGKRVKHKYLWSIEQSPVGAAHPENGKKAG